MSLPLPAVCTSANIATSEDERSREFGLFIRLPSKPPESELLLGDTERRSGVYSEVHEHSSTGSTQQETDCGGLVAVSIMSLRA
ncbi:MAG: hypothetical protein LBJ69_00575 [Holosporales bacterium]|nr:hypothetical protein [Holosporales bacterium]